MSPHLYEGWTVQALAKLWWRGLWLHKRLPPAGRSPFSCARLAELDASLISIVSAFRVLSSAETHQSVGISKILSGNVFIAVLIFPPGMGCSARVIACARYWRVQSHTIYLDPEAGQHMPYFLAIALSLSTQPLVSCDRVRTSCRSGWVRQRGCCGCCLRRLSAVSRPLSSSTRSTASPRCFLQLLLFAAAFNTICSHRAYQCTASNRTLWSTYMAWACAGWQGIVLKVTFPAPITGVNSQKGGCSTDST